MLRPRDRTLPEPDPRWDFKRTESQGHPHAEDAGRNPTRLGRRRCDARCGTTLEVLSWLGQNEASIERIRAGQEPVRYTRQKHHSCTIYFLTPLELRRFGPARTTASTFCEGPYRSLPNERLLTTLQSPNRHRQRLSRGPGGPRFAMVDWDCQW